MLNPEQVQLEKTLNQEALALLESGVIKGYSAEDLQAVYAQMQSDYDKYSKLGMNCLGIVALRNAASQLLRAQRLQAIGV